MDDQCRLLDMEMGLEFMPCNGYFKTNYTFTSNINHDMSEELKTIVALVYVFVFYVNLHPWHPLNNEIC